MSDNIKISWGEVESFVANIAQQMIADDFKPNIVVTILRGGIVPARLLCNYFDNTILFTVTAKLYDKENDCKTDKACTHYVGEVKMSNFNIPIDGNEKIVIIDDISDSGKTFKAVLEEMYQEYAVLYDNSLCGGGKLRTASLLVREKSVFIPDFYGEKVSHDKWFDFPWENKAENRRANFCAIIDGEPCFGYED
jgi:hypoxanthine phosphoribosyltransferase